VVVQKEFLAGPFRAHATNRQFVTAYFNFAGGLHHSLARSLLSIITCPAWPLLSNTHDCIPSFLTLPGDCLCSQSATASATRS
jgi:hypothetical protein